MSKTFYILESYSRGQIEDEVTEYMAKGWFPYGPVETVKTPAATLYRVTVLLMPKPSQVIEVPEPTIH